MPFFLGLYEKKDHSSISSEDQIGPFLCISRADHKWRCMKQSFPSSFSIALHFMFHFAEIHTFSLLFTLLTSRKNSPGFLVKSQNVFGMILRTTAVTWCFNFPLTIALLTLLPAFITVFEHLQRLPYIFGYKDNSTSRLLYLEGVNTSVGLVCEEIWYHEHEWLVLITFSQIDSIFLISPI